MNSTFKLSLLVAAFAFAVPSVAMATSHHSTHAVNHKARHVKGKKTGHRHHAAYNQDQTTQDQATQDLNARSLQTVQSVNRDPNTGVLSPQNRVGQPAPAMQPVSGGQTVAPPLPSMGNPNVPSNVPGAVNPNNMPPAN